MRFFRLIQAFAVVLPITLSAAVFPANALRDVAPTRIAAIPQQDAWLRITAVPRQGVLLNLWATFYYIHRAATVPFGGVPLLDLQNNFLGPILSPRDWCYAALQGTVMVEDRYTSGVYNFAGRGFEPQIDCSPLFSSLSSGTIAKVNRARFKPATATYGYGTAGFRLVPYRTIAVDRNRIPIGSVLYIPAARGRTVTLPTGKQVIHDGYFFAGDVGSAIKDNQIDVFIGLTEFNPFPFVTSRRNDGFEAYLVQDDSVTQALWALHRP